MQLDSIIVLSWFVGAIIIIGIIIGILFGINDGIDVEKLRGSLFVGVFWPILLPIFIVAMITKGIVMLINRLRE